MGKGVEFFSTFGFILHCTKRAQKQKHNRPMETTQEHFLLLKKKAAIQEKSWCISRKRVHNAHFKHAYFKVRTLTPRYRTFRSQDNCKDSRLDVPKSCICEYSWELNREHLNSGNFGPFDKLIALSYLNTVLVKVSSPYFAAF